MWDYMGQCKTLVFTLNEMWKPLKSVHQKSLWIKGRVSVQLDCKGAGAEAWRPVRTLLECSRQERMWLQPR